MSPLTLVAAFLVVAAGACIQGSLGFGLGLIGAPVLALLDDDFVPGPLLFVGVVLTAIVAARERGELDWRGIRWALVGRVFGTVIGTIAITRVSEDGLVALLAVSILVAVALSVAGWHVRPTPTTLVGAGTVSGVMGMLTSVGGPPMAIVYQRERAAQLRTTLAGFFLFGASLALAALVLGGEFGLHELGLGVLLLPGLALGLLASRWLGRYLDHGWTRPAVLAFSAISAILLLVQLAS
ncbi:MAG TPA: sulfite exporter TauE/SafE family protein [Acidimicrobiales bacterium]